MVADLIITGTPTSPHDGGYTRANLRELARWYLDKYGANDLLDTKAAEWDLNECLGMAYQQYCYETKCLKAIMTASTVTDQDVYALSDFGSGDGIRIFSIETLSYAGNQLERIDPHDLDTVAPTWRGEAHGTPTYWMPWGEGEIRLWRKPDGVGTLSVEGWATPDLTPFETDTAAPAIHEANQYLLAVYAAILFCERNPSDDNRQRIQALLPIWAAGVAKARRIASASGGKHLILGKYAGRKPTARYTVGTITSI